MAGDAEAVVGLCGTGGGPMTEVRREEEGDIVGGGAEVVVGILLRGERGTEFRSGAILELSNGRNGRYERRARVKPSSLDRDE